MTTKAARDEMLQAHAAMALVLDSKIGQMPEWKAFRAIDRALIALEADVVTLKIPKAPLMQPQRTPLSPQNMTYVQLAQRLLNEVKTPVTTQRVVAYIANHRNFSDLAKAKINIISSLSKDPQFKSVPWQGGKAWWWSDRPEPKPDQTDIMEGLSK